MNNVVFGKNVNVECLVDGDYVVIGCAVSCSFQFENELIGKTDVNAGLFRKKRVRISNNSGSVQGLTTLNNTVDRLTAFYFLQEAIRRTEQNMRFVFVDEIGDTRTITGLFLVQAVSLTGETSSFSEFDLTLDGTGGIEIGTVALPPDAVCADMFSDYWETTPGGTSITGPGVQGRSFAGSDILEVDREGLQHDPAVGVPGNRQYAYNGVAISIDPTNPFNTGERMFVVWKDFES